MGKSTCRWPECDRDVYGHGLCQRDYKRAKKVGDFSSPWLNWSPPKRHAHLTECRWPECNAEPKQQGYCWRDLGRARAVGNFDQPWLYWPAPRGHDVRSMCRWPECQDFASSAGMCQMHRARGDRMGNVVDPWLTWQRNPYCMFCDEPFDASRSTQRFCSSRCSVADWVQRNPSHYKAMCAKASAKRRARLKAVPSETFTISEVRAARGDACHLCGEPINFSLKWPDPMSPSLDHLVPIARGGGHLLSNAAMAHLTCNIRKGARFSSAGNPALSTLT